MSIIKKTEPGKKSPATPPPAPTAPAPTETGGKLPPLYRPIDWLTALVTTVLVFAGYYWTLAPDLTLEDSGELAVGSMYASVPHPPGYPVWSIFTWVFTKILPFSNIAWRVAVASAFAGALASGLLGLMVSRGSSMMIESIAELKGIPRKLENLCCIVPGVVAGMLLGFNGFVWSQAVIVEVYSLSTLSLAAVLCLLLHYIYNPRKKRYLFLAFFLFGICFTNHQSLLLAAVGVEVAVLMADRQIGRLLFLGNSLLYTLGLTVMAFGGGESFTGNPPLFLIFNTVGILSLAVFLWTTVRLETLTKWLVVVVHVLINMLVFWMWVKMQGKATSTRELDGLARGYVSFLLIFNPVLMLGAYGLALLVGGAEKILHTTSEWLAFLVVFALGFLWLFGAAFNLWMPITSMTNPPMNWGYPRTFDGFLHAMSRGQYERTSPCDFVSNPGRFLMQLGVYFWASMKEFNPVFFAFLVVPFLFFFRMQKRERGWLVSIASIWAGLGVLLLIMLNPNPDRQTQDLVKVFFTASYVLLAMLIGYGITLCLVSLCMQYARYRLAAICTSGLVAMIAAGGAIYTYLDSPYWLIRAIALFGLGLAVVACALLLTYRQRAPLAGLLVLVALMPVYPFAANWETNEQREHYFGFWFGHDMFEPGMDTKAAPAPKGKDGKPLYPSMDKDTVLFGGTDPGRFCPTYMIFCESFIPPQDRLNPAFDRRDVYIITQNALADGTYLNYIRAHYNRSAQYPLDTPFFAGGVDRFTLSQEDRDRKARGEYYPKSAAGEFLTKVIARPLDNFFTDLGDRVERERRAGSSFFKPADFTNLAELVARIKPGPQQDALGKFLHERLTKDTQGVLAGGNEAALRSALAKDLNVIIELETTNIRKLQDLAQEMGILQAESATRNQKRIDELKQESDRLLALETIYTTNKFAGIKLSDHLVRFLNENPQRWTRIRMNRLLLEEAYPQFIARSLGGLYPDLEIHTGSPKDSQECFSEYINDVQKRLEHDRTHPNEPPQLKPGEDVKLTPDGRVQVAGQVAVMAINGLITKRIFDQNPKHEFYVEESFPLDWMYPYLTPFGIIMKINRQPLPELTDEILQRDHEYWSQYSDRLIGNWITYDTTVQEIADFTERVYVRRDYTGFKGDPKFIRDDQSQKAFSKLRSSIAGVYAWRVNDCYRRLIGTPAGAERSRLQAEYDRTVREADFAFKQALAFCPYSPEAVFRYINILFSQQKYPEALVVAETCLKLDPHNGQVAGLVKQLRDQLPGYRQNQAAISAMQSNLMVFEKQYRAQPNNISNAFALVSSYLALGETNQAFAVLDGMVASPDATADGILGAADLLSKIERFPNPRLGKALARLVTLQTDNPEAWFDLAGYYVATGKTVEGLEALRKSITLSEARQTRVPGARDLRAAARTNDHFARIRATPEFQKLISSPQQPQQPERPAN